MAVAMNLRGDTSKDVSDTILPNACMVKTIARRSGHLGPINRRLICASVLSSWSGVRDGISWPGADGGISL